MRILYVGPNKGTCLRRRLALERLGHEVFVVDPFAAFGSWRPLCAWSFRTGALGLPAIVDPHVLGRIGRREFDLAVVDSGELIGPDLVERLRDHAPRVVNRNPDNPFTARDGRRWRLFRKALPHYDLFVTPRRSSAEAALAAGARRVQHTDFSADELLHRPRELSSDEAARFSAEVGFVGTWMAERGPFVSKLLDAGVPLTIYGARWERAPEWERIAACVALGELDADDYARAVLGTGVALGLLSVGNEDLHTSRSLEIPAMGVLFCAQRTDDHAAMYVDGEEAVLWDDAEECAEKCLELLREPERIAAIARAGRRRVHENRSFHEPLMAGMVAEAVRPDARALEGTITPHPTLVNRRCYEAAKAKPVQLAS